jgi:hypothetical protein
MDILQGKKGFIYIIGMYFRPGCLSYATDLEHKYFSPKCPDLNELYNLFTIKYDSIMYFIIEIPSTVEVFEKCQTLASEYNLKLVEGKPWNGVTEFPVKCLADACFTLEILDHEKYSMVDIKDVIMKQVDEIKNKYT